MGLCKVTGERPRPRSPAALRVGDPGACSCGLPHLTQTTCQICGLGITGNSNARLRALDFRAYELRSGLLWSPTLRAEHHSRKNGYPGSLASRRKPALFKGWRSRFRLAVPFPQARQASGPPQPVVRPRFPADFQAPKSVHATVPRREGPHLSGIAGQP
jgi:hypothetical protein